MRRIMALAALLAFALSLGGAVWAQSVCVPKTVTGQVTWVDTAGWAVKVKSGDTTVQLWVQAGQTNTDRLRTAVKALRAGDRVNARYVECTGEVKLHLTKIEKQ